MRIKKVEISDDVAAVLGRGTWDGPAFALNEGKMDRPLYEATDKVLRALGGKWNKGARAHLFALDDRAAMQAALEVGHVVDQKKTLEQFFTPDHLAERMADMIDVCDGMHVLEPSAGEGRLVRAAIERGANITAVEMDQALLPALVAIGNTRFGWLRVSIADFMTWSPADAPVSVDVFFHDIDAVMMNPPFSAGQDIRHVCHALNFLRPGGKLVAIMSPHFLYATDKLSVGFRRLIGFPEGLRLGPDTGVELSGDLGIARVNVEVLPAGTFKAEGTNVSTVLVFIEKAT